MTALSWIVKEAKHLRRKYPHRYDSLANPWRDGYVAQASKIYATKHKGKSPVGHKRHKPHKKKVTARRSVKGIRTTSRTHTDKNRITANIQVGSVGAAALTAELKRRIKTGIDRHVLAKYHSSTKRDKKRHQKEITHLKTRLRRLS